MLSLSTVSASHDFFLAVLKVVAQQSETSFFSSSTLCLCVCTQIVHALHLTIAQGVGVSVCVILTGLFIFWSLSSDGSVVLFALQ